MARSDDATTPIAQAPEATSIATPDPTPKPEPKRLTKADFVARAEKICAKLNVLEPSVSEEAGLDESADAVGAFRTEFDRLLGELLDLRPPSKDESFLKQNMFTPLKDIRKISNNLFTRMEDALREGDLVELNEIDRTLYAMGDPFVSESAVDQKLRQYGFRACIGDDVSTAA